ncbi:hypothetical protein ACJX0J_025682, partial [Zea mays]
MIWYNKFVTNSLVCDASIPLGGASLWSFGHYAFNDELSCVAGQGARPALRWTAVIGGLGGLEEGHYAAYIKMLLLRYFQVISLLIIIVLICSLILLHLLVYTRAHQTRAHQILAGYMHSFGILGHDGSVGQGIWPS